MTTESRGSGKLLMSDAYLSMSTTDACLLMSTTDACLGLGYVEGGGEDDACDNDGNESIWTLFEGLSTPLLAAVGCRLRPQLPAVSDSLRGGLNASVRASKTCGDGNTCLSHLLTLRLGVPRANKSIFVEC